jgi:RNA polymerase sigma factor for flagellar operon FliA
VERNFFGDESLTDIAQDLGVTLSRVSQMRARALTLLHAAMSEVWEGRAVPADGGVRARNQQRTYVERVAGRAPVPASLPRQRPDGPAAERRHDAPERTPAKKDIRFASSHRRPTP